MKANSWIYLSKRNLVPGFFPGFYRCNAEKKIELKEPDLFEMKESGGIKRFFKRRGWLLDPVELIVYIYDMRNFGTLLIGEIYFDYKKEEFLRYRGKDIGFETLTDNFKKI